MNSKMNMYLGNTYLSAYSIAVKHGFVGSEQDWLDSLSSGKLEIKYVPEREMICWRHEGDSEWRDLMTLAELQKNMMSNIIDGMREAAKSFAQLSESWAVGGTGVRPGENTDNSKYWAEQAAKGGSGGSDGKRAATVTVGARNAGHTAGEVDFLCSGTSDDEKLTAALAEAKSRGHGTVAVLPGTYSLNATVDIDTIVFAWGARFETDKSLANGMFRIEDGQLIGADLMKKTSTGTACINADLGSRISSCQFFPAENDVGIKAVNSNVSGSRWNVVVEECSFLTECQTAVELTAVGQVRDCFITKVRKYGVHAPMQHNLIEGNVIDCHFNDRNPGAVGIYIEGSYNNAVGNTVRNCFSEDVEFVLGTEAKSNMVAGNFARITAKTTGNYIMSNVGDSAGGAVDSVNGKTGTVVLKAADVGAAAENHKHSAEDITSGVLPISQGGTGASTLFAARTALQIGGRGICSSPSSMAAKTVPVEGMTAAITGVLIFVNFTYGSTSTALTLNVSGLGNMSVRHHGKALTASMIPAGWEAMLVLVMGSGGTRQWELLNPFKA